ncbi:MAG: hypothetical protein ACYCSH_10285 [Acidithiobacillus sp.]
MQPNESLEKALARKRIPPRALRSDIAQGTVWVPRWEWARHIFGREVRLPPLPGESRSPVAQRTGPNSEQPVPAEPKPVATDQPASAAKTETDGEPWGQWAYPLLVILAALVLAYALGVASGYVLAVGHLPGWMSGGVLGAFLEAPSGAVLLLLAGLTCFVQARDDRESRKIWKIAGAGLLILFLLATFGGLL